jgi:hypothetical protein
LLACSAQSQLERERRQGGVNHSEVKAEQQGAKRSDSHERQHAVDARVDWL